MRGINIFKIVSVVLGSILVIFGVLALTVFPHFVNEEVSKRTYLGFDKNGSYNEMTQKWIEPEYSMSMRIWMYSIDNEADVINNGSMPHFVEKGPYTFVQYQKKSKVDFMYNDTRVLYRTKRTYFFNSTLSCSTCELSDKVTVPNPVFQSFVDIANSGGILVKEAIELVLSMFKRETPFVTATVGEMLFDGFEDPVISSVCNKQVLKTLCKSAKIPLKIGFFYGQNGTDDGEYLIDTGLAHTQDLGKVYEYDGQFRLPDAYWYSPQARMLNGTNEMFPPSLSSSERLYMFLGQMKRSIYLQYKKKSNVDGVPAWRYVIPSEMYDYELPENNGFCNPKTPRFFDNQTQPDGCLPRGFLDMGSTQPGNPRIYLSGSHFYNSPPVVYENFPGLQKPVAENDEPQYEIEPTTGVIVQVKQRTQINVGMVAGNLRMLSKMRDMILPVLWFNETVHFDSGTRAELLNNLISVQNVAYTTGIALLVLGLILLIAFVIVMIVDECIMKVSEDQERLITNDESGVAPYGSSESFPTIEPLPVISPLSVDPPLLTGNPPLLAAALPERPHGVYIEQP